MRAGFFWPETDSADPRRKGPALRQTMTVVGGLDAHARSTQAAAIDLLSGELRRARFGGGAEAVMEWLSGLAAPVRCAYEAEPTGFGLARVAAAAGVDVILGPLPLAQTTRLLAGPDTLA